MALRGALPEQPQDFGDTGIDVVLDLVGRVFDELAALLHGAGLGDDLPQARHQRGDAIDVPLDRLQIQLAAGAAC